MKSSSTASLSRAANVATVWSASYRARLNRPAPILTGRAASSLLVAVLV
jgi:hypothetical protein